MKFPIQPLRVEDFPVGFAEIPHPPEKLYARGSLPATDLTLLSVVGSRKYSTYGKQVVAELIAGLRDYPIGIVSGLALGIDSLAHQAALDNNLYTLAIPGGGLSDEVLYPASHKALAYQILEAGGGLLSEFAPTFKATRWSFPQRNRLVAGISQATLLIEAEEKSGTLITARLTADYNRELLVVPGSIFSKTSQGTHQFLKLGATPVTSGADILDALNVAVAERNYTAPSPTLTATEENVINILREPTHRDELIRKLELSTADAGELLMTMELNGHITCERNQYRTRNI